MPTTMDVELTVPLADIAEALFHLEKLPGETEVWPLKARLIVPLDREAEPLNGGAAMAERVALEKRMIDEAANAARLGADAAQAAVDELTQDEVTRGYTRPESEGMSIDLPSFDSGDYDDRPPYGDDDFDDDDEAARPRYRVEPLPVGFTFPAGRYRANLRYPFKNAQPVEIEFAEGRAPTATAIAQWLALEYFDAYARNADWETENPEPSELAEQPWNLSNRKPTYVPEGARVPRTVPLVWGHEFEDLLLEGFTLTIEEETGVVNVDPAIGS